MADDLNPEWPVSFRDACRVVATLQDQLDEAHNEITSLEKRLFGRLEEPTKRFLREMLTAEFDRMRDDIDTRQEFAEACKALDEIAWLANLPGNIWGDGKSALEVGMTWWDSRCPDCGDSGEQRGHQTCQYPSNDQD